MNHLERITPRIIGDAAKRLAETVAAFWQGCETRLAEQARQELEARVFRDVEATCQSIEEFLGYAETTGILIPRALIEHFTTEQAAPPPPPPPLPPLTLSMASTPTVSGNSTERVDTPLNALQSPTGL